MARKKSMFRELRVPLNPDAGAAAAVNHKFDFYNKNVVYINRSVLNEIINHCREDLPYEACGLLSGQHGRNEMMWKIRSTEKSPTSFAMDMNQVSAALSGMKKLSQTMTGMYHSHPSAAPLPSRDDIRNFHDPAAAYFIISFANRKTSVKCFKIIDHKAFQVKFEVIR